MYSKRTAAVAAGADANLFTGSGGLYGIRLRDVTAVAAPGTVTIYDNTSAAGDILAVIRLAADGRTPPIFWKRGVRFDTGIHLAAVGADVSGHVLIGAPGALQAVPFAADLQLSATPRQLDSILVAETAGAAAEWRIYDALAAAGNAFDGNTHAADTTVFLDEQVKLGTGLFFDVQSGAVAGAAYLL